MMIDSKIIAGFSQAIREAGIDYNEPIEPDGQLHRFHIDGDKPGSRNGWAVLFDGEVPAGAFGCWKRNIHEKWCSKHTDQLSKKEYADYKSKLLEANILREKEQAKIHAEARKESARIWNESKVVQGHEYLTAKGVKVFGIREHNGTLIVPLKDSEGVLHSLQSIGSNGTKRFLPGGKIKGCYHLIGTPDKILYIAEGYSTAASIHEATGEAVAVAFDTGNLKPVAESLRRKYGDISIVIAADNDAHTEGNPGLAKAEEAALAIGGKVAVPEFKDMSSKSTDFNDLFQLEGAKRVKELLGKVHKPNPSLKVIEAKIAEWAKLHPVEWDRIKADAADQLDCNVSTLDAEVKKKRPRNETSKVEGGKPVMFEKIEPWPEPVDGAALLSGLVSTIVLYCILPEGAALAIALWIIHTYCHDAAMISPILAITSPEKRCGKTTVLIVLQRLVCKPLSAANITSAALFRTTELLNPTLLVDEFDTFSRQNDELRGVFNSGHQRETAFIIRTVPVGDSHEPRQFCTWAPKAIALIGKLQDTLSDRSIEIPMKRKVFGERVNRLRGARTVFLEYRRKLTRWATDNLEVLKDAEPKIPDDLNDRAKDNWEPLLAIAERVGGEWPQKALAALRALTPSDGEDESLREMLLGDIKKLFKTKRLDRITSIELVDALGEKEDRPWPEYYHGKPITARQVAKLLKPIGVIPKQLRTENGNLRGYVKKTLQMLLPDTSPIYTLHRYKPVIERDCGIFHPLQRKIL